MTWNYRVVKQTYETEQESEQEFVIQEVYYDQDGKPSGYCSAYLSGESIESLEWMIDKLRKALLEPVLNDDDFDDKRVLDGPDRDIQHTDGSPDRQG